MNISQEKNKLADKIHNLVIEAGEASQNADEQYGEATPEGYLFNAILKSLERSYVTCALGENEADKQYGVEQLQSV